MFVRSDPNKIIINLENTLWLHSKWPGKYFFLLVGSSHHNVVKIFLLLKCFLNSITITKLNYCL